MKRSVRNLILLGLAIVIVSWGCGRKAPLQPLRSQSQMALSKNDEMIDLDSLAG